jgi:hypothetical protein
MWPQGVSSGLGVMDDLVSLQMASGVSGGLVPSWVTMAGHEWPWGFQLTSAGRE